MELHVVKEEALLSWINSVNPEAPVTKLIQMMDAHQLLKLACKVLRRASCDAADELEMIFTLLQEDFRLMPQQASLILEKMKQGVEPEIQLAKVLLVLCYCGFKKHNLPPLDTKTEITIASMFHFVQDDADYLFLDRGLDGFLKKASVLTFSTSSLESSSPLSTGESPYFSRFRNAPRVHFQEVFTVASSSAGSPVPNAMSTPHFQLKRLRQELAHEGDIRDELEKELADQISIISEKEGLISQLQHRVERMLREQGELEKDHKAALLELQEKNESLLHRVHEVLKQCQDLKTDNSQKEKKIDELTEENGTLTAQMRNAFSQLARMKEEVTKLTLAHESAQAEWKNRKEFLERELNEAVTHRECLSEQVQILQGKISVLEDELKKAQSQERGEVLGLSVEGLMEIESLQTRVLNQAEISLKDEEIRNLRSKCDSVDQELTFMKQQNLEMNKTIQSNRKEHDKTVWELQRELQSVSSVVSEKQKEILLLSAEVTALKVQVCQNNENEVQKRQELSATKDKLTSVQVQLNKAIQSELHHRQTLKEKAQEFEKTVSRLQAEISAISSDKDAHINALKAEMTDQQLRFERLGAQLEHQSSSILTLKSVARRFEQQNKDLVEKLKSAFEQLSHYSAKHQGAQEMNRSLEKSLQASRREVQALQMERDQMHFAEKHLKEDLRPKENLRAPETPLDPIAEDVDGAADDWMRIAELQARNKACLPHLKSSYALESRPTVGRPSLTLTDDDLRMGDPKETILRVALHLQESQNDHIPQSRKCMGPLNDLNTPELQQRRSVTFTIANTPAMHNGGSLLQRGLKRRNDACKSPTALSRALRTRVLR